MMKHTYQHCFYDNEETTDDIFQEVPTDDVSSPKQSSNHDSCSAQTKYLKTKMKKVGERVRLDMMSSSVLFLSMFFQPYCIVTACCVVNIEKRNWNCSLKKEFLSGDCNFKHYSGDVWSYFNVWYWIFKMFGHLLWDSQATLILTPIEHWAAQQCLTIALCSVIMGIAVVCGINKIPYTKYLCTFPEWIRKIIDYLSLQKWLILLVAGVLTCVTLFIKGGMKHVCNIHIVQQYQARKLEEKNL